jgi:uncharacterized protein YfbU (UPF0304 family)
MYLCRILGNQEPDNKADFERDALILQRGYTYFYDEVFGDLWDVMEPRVGNFVIAVLNMYRSLYSSFKALGKPDAEKEKRLIFQGFDDNYETDYYAFAEFVLKNMGRFAEFAHAQLNSFSFMEDKYEAMLDVFLEISGGQPLKDDLTEAEIERVLAGGGRVYT